MEKSANIIVIVAHEDIKPILLEGLKDSLGEHGILLVKNEPIPFTAPRLNYIETINTKLLTKSRERNFRFKQRYLEHKFNRIKRR